MTLTKSLIALMLGAMLTLCIGCSTTSAVMPHSSGGYTVSKSGTTGFTPLGSLRKDAYQEANRFAASKGMVAEVISVNEVPAGFGRWPQVELRFRLVKPGSGGVSADPAVKVSTSASHDAMGNATDSTTTVSKEKSVDELDELKRLWELKEKGIITEEEFQKEKKRLLDLREK